MSDRLTPDSQVVALLCSHLALPPRQPSAEHKPLSPREWDHLAKRVWQSNLKRPAALLELDVATLREELGISQMDAQRIHLLLGRGAQLAIEVERLSQLGIWILTRADEHYPHRLRDLLGPAAAPVLCGAGPRELLDTGFLAIAGSRDADDNGIEFARALGARCGREQLTLVTGMARGVDSVSIEAVLASGGKAIGVLADSLEGVLRKRDVRSYVADGRLVLITAQHPRTGFSVGAAFARNKYIYCLARYGLVVYSTADRGGTRGGALEVLKTRWVPLFVRSFADMPEGNRLLLHEGGIAFGEMSLQFDMPLTELFEAEVARNVDNVVSTTPASANNESLAVAKTSQGDLFPVVWPYIAEILATTHTVDGVADALSLQTAQAHSWLERAVDLGHARHRTRRNEYELAASLHTLKQAQLL